MSLLVVGYPELEKADFDWIQSIRVDYDELGYTLIEPHFTLVFQVDGNIEGEFVEHVRAAAADSHAIPFVLRRAEILPDDDAGYSYAALTPDEGHREIVELHDMLYTDRLAEKLRHDIPYVPHITLGNSKDRGICETLCGRINRVGVSIAGRISGVAVISHEENRITLIERISLRD